MAVKLSPVFNDAQLDSSGNPYVGPSAQRSRGQRGSVARMTELEQLRFEVCELREVVLNLLHIENQKRGHLFNLPRGAGMRPDQTFFNQVRLCGELGAIPSNTLSIEGAPWVEALHKSAGTTFDERRTKFRARVASEEAERAAKRKAAQ